MQSVPFAIRAVAHWSGTQELNLVSPVSETGGLPSSSYPIDLAACLANYTNEVQDPVRESNPPYHLSG